MISGHYQAVIDVTLVRIVDPQGSGLTKVRERLADLPMMADGVREASDAPTMVFVESVDHSPPGRDSLSAHGVRMIRADPPPSTSGEELGSSATQKSAPLIDR
jgi:hypothetical protein